MCSMPTILLILWIIEKLSKNCTHVETKIVNSPPVDTVIIRILQLLVALYLSFLSSHRYRTKQNRSCQLLLNVKIWLLYTMPEANKLSLILHVRVNQWEKCCYFIQNITSSVGKTEGSEP
jgi:uncharacterized protein YacL